MLNRVDRCQIWSNDQVGFNPSAAPGIVDGTTRKAWFQLGGMVAGIAVLAWALPGPASVLTILTGGFGPTAEPDLVVSASALVAAALIVWVLLGWGLLVAVAAAVGHLPGRAGRRGYLLLARIAPAAARKLVLPAVGVSLLAGLAVGASGTATAGSSSTCTPVAHACTTSWTSVEGSAVQLGINPGPASNTTHPVNLDRPGGDAADGDMSIDVDWPCAPGQASRSAATSIATVGVDWPGSTDPVVVLRGDSLWSIAARHLPATATRADISRAWHRWYAANRAVIGTDPDLILPGQILLPPTTTNGK